MAEFDDRLIAALRQAKHVVVFTGAGASAESGIPTFRDKQTGMWEKFDAAQLATPAAFRKDPPLVWGWYESRRAAVLRAQPNGAHRAIATISARVPRLTLITQNVDDLHERAGSKRLLHMHGELEKARCERECGRAPVEDHAIYQNLAEVGRCACGGRLRPHIVFFGEIPLEMDRIQEEIAKATLMVVVGTSGSVYPAANFVHWARQGGARTVYIGPEQPLNAHAFTNVVLGKAGEVMPGLFQLE